ncbi:formylglycine-generating enzyme family protein [Erwinia sorbitola]|nr:formylglycine-generating enzyme family protein [Erwinia sorbitola]
MQRICIFLVAMAAAGCDQNTVATETGHSPEDYARLEQFIQQVKSQLIFVEGGEFLMGDFGEQYGRDRLPFDSRQDSKPLHQVALTSYSLSKFKASNQQYQFYLEWNDIKGRSFKGRLRAKDWEERAQTSGTPAHVDWNEAREYCDWLAKITELPFSLPTEAQWEYAARSRGQYFAAPTDDGTLRIEGRKGINVATGYDRKAYASEAGTGLEYSSPTPGDFRPPNPLGIYDMAGNGWEWVKDWYDPDYYKHSPVKDPQGPDKPVFKDIDGHYTRVLRSQDFSSWWGGLTMTRFNADPESQLHPPGDKTVRCAVNSPHPVK